MTVTSMLRTFGIDLKKFKRALRSLPYYIKNRREFMGQWRKHGTSEFTRGRFRPCLFDRFESGGVAAGHYFHQDLLVAQLIYKRQPTIHIDIGSRIDGFVAHVATFRKVQVLDIRAVQSAVTNIEFHEHDLMLDDEKWHDITDSLSCLHALEHFGLGRYGDPIDFNGHLKGFTNLTRMLKPNGMLYFSVPVSGQPRIEIDAHRVFGFDYLERMFNENNLALKNFHCVDDNGELHKNVPLTDAPDKIKILHYGCGIFELTKKTKVHDSASL